MKLLLRLCGLLLVPRLAAFAQAQIRRLKVAKIEIKHVGPPSVSDDLIRANIRVKPGDPLPARASMRMSGISTRPAYFYNVRVSTETRRMASILTYILQGNPQLDRNQISGQQKIKDAKLRKKSPSKVGEPFNERKLFTDSQEIQKMYQKAGYPGTTVKYSICHRAKAPAAPRHFRDQGKPEGQNHAS